MHAVIWIDNSFEFQWFMKKMVKSQIKLRSIFRWCVMQISTLYNKITMKIMTHHNCYIIWTFIPWIISIETINCSSTCCRDNGHQFEANRKDQD